MVRLACLMGDDDGGASWFARSEQLKQSVAASDVQLAALLALVVYAQHSGDRQQALSYAEACDALARQFSHSYNQAHASAGAGAGSS